MVTHYFTAPENVACGRAGANLNGSQDLAEQFAQHVLSPEGQQVLAGAGFGTP